MPTTRTRYTTKDVRELQSDALAQPSKLDAVQHLHTHYPHCSPRWIARHLDTLTSLDPEALIAWIGHPDPTGEAAVRNVMEEAA
jgi:hypothetical protein